MTLKHISNLTLVLNRRAKAPVKMSDLSVVIVNWNTEALLKDCLRSIFDNTSGLDFEVCVVDNNSSDGSVAMLEKEFRGVRLVKNTENLGFSKANNQVLRECKARYALLLNSDTIVLGNVFKEMVDLMDGDINIGAAGCQLLNDDRTLQVSCARFPKLTSILFGGAACNNLFKKLFPRRRFFAEYGLSAEEHQSKQDVDFVTGCCLILRTSILSETGLLDENIFMYFEEIDLCYRIKKAGYSVCYTPDSKIVHLGKGSSRVFRDTVFRNLSSQEYFFWKHYGRAQAIAMRLIVIVGALFRLPLFLGMSLVSGREMRATSKSKLMWTLHTLCWGAIGRSIQLKEPKP